MSKALVPKRGSLPRAADLCLWTAALQAAAVLGEIAAVDPAEYERQQNASGEKAGVRSVAAFVKEMAAQLPRCVEDMGATCVRPCDIACLLGWLRAARSACHHPHPFLHVDAG